MTSGPTERSRRWEALVAALDTWADAAHAVPGGIEVRLSRAGATHSVVVVMTPEEWEEMTGIEWGPAEVQATLDGLGPEEGFAVYEDYRLYPSTGPTLPSPPTRPAGLGHWFVRDHDGGVEGRFADWDQRQSCPAEGDDPSGG